MRIIRSIYKKAMLGFLTLLMSGVSVLGIQLADTYTPDTFPIYAPEAQAEGTIRVMSFNIRYADVNDVPALLRRTVVSDQILAVMPDSFGVQEATGPWMRYLRAALPDYASAGKGRDGDDRGEHSAIFYRTDKYHMLSTGTFWLSDTPEKPSKALDAGCRRICTWAILEDFHTGERYVHVNSHFDNMGEQAREFEAKMITDYIEERFSGLSVVFTADMNCFADEPTYDTMTRDLIDTRETADKAEIYSTFHDGDPQRCAEVIDYILCSDDFHPTVFKTVTSGIDGRFVSDHFPIYADLVRTN